MSAEIKGLVRGPSGEIVPATVTLKPIPDPMRGSEGSVVTGGVVAASVRGPVPTPTLGRRSRLVGRVVLAR